RSGIHVIFRRDNGARHTRLPSQPITSGPTLPGIFVPQRGHGPGTKPEVLDAHPLIGRVGVLAGQAKAYEQHRSAEDSLKVTDHRNRSTLSNDHRIAAESRL